MRDEEISEVFKTRDAALDLLRQLQWGGGFDDYERPLCPFCQSYEKRGHIADCELSKLIAD